jgi:hypothetical protein
LPALADQARVGDRDLVRDQAELLEHGDAVVQADLVGDRPFSTFTMEMPVKHIVPPVLTGRARADGHVLERRPVWVPPPFHWPTTWSRSARMSAVPQRLKFGNTGRNVVANARP